MQYKKWMRETNLIRVTGWARDGLDDVEIVRRMGISSKTFYEWKKRFPEFAQALEEGREVPDRKVENALYGAALGGDVGAQKFWLTNRKPSTWRDKRDVSFEGEIPVVLVDNVKG